MIDQDAPMTATEVRQRWDNYWQNGHGKLVSLADKWHRKVYQMALAKLIFKNVSLAKFSNRSRKPLARLKHSLTRIQMPELSLK